MPWVWSDELAELLETEGSIRDSQLQSWRTRPVGLAAPADESLLTFGRRLLGLTVTEPEPDSGPVTSGVCTCGSAAGGDPSPAAAG